MVYKDIRKIYCPEEYECSGRVRQIKFIHSFVKQVYIEPYSGLDTLLVISGYIRFGSCSLVILIFSREERQVNSPSPPVSPSKHFVKVYTGC